MPRNLVLFDLEWNIGYQPYTFNYHGVQQTFRGEIVEIGAVKIDEDANVLDTFSIHLRPRIFRKLQHHIAKVTGLTQADLDKGEPIVQGLRRFMQWCGPDAEFAEWGMDDVPVLKQNLYLCNIDESKPTIWYDLQQVFLREHPRKEGEGMTLESVVTRLGLPMERQFHDALSDTLYTADVCRMLDLRAGLAAYPTEEESLRASLCPTPGDYRDFEVFRGYVEQSTWRSDPKIITASCPVCGGPLTPDDVWLKKGSNSWYTLSQCPHCAGSSNAAGKGVFQRYKLARRDGLHWSYARCLQIPDDASLARWEKQRTGQKKCRFVFMLVSYNMDILRIEEPADGKAQAEGMDVHNELLSAPAGNAGVLGNSAGQFWQPWPHCPHHAGHGGVVFSAASAHCHCGAECSGSRRHSGFSVQLGRCGAGRQHHVPVLAAGGQVLLLEVCLPLAQAGKGSAVGEPL